MHGTPTFGSFQLSSTQLGLGRVGGVYNELRLIEVEECKLDASYNKAKTVAGCRQLRDHKQLFVEVKSVATARVRCNHYTRFLHNQKVANPERRLLIRVYKFQLFVSCIDETLTHCNSNELINCRSVNFFVVEFIKKNPVLNQRSKPFYTARSRLTSVTLKEKQYAAIALL